MEDVIQKVQTWFGQNWTGLSRSFPFVGLRLSQATDLLRGGVTIQIDGPIAGASITFWNKGDVQALALDKKQGKEHVFDDRKLDPSESVEFLLQSYVEKLVRLLDTTGS